MQNIHHIVVAGGGTAGWLTAGRIAAQFRHQTQAVRVSLIESANIPLVGVGEGTWPTMRNTLIQLGISETDFIRQCDVGFKQGAKFVGWVNGKPNDAYYHPLTLPQGFGKTNLSAYWQLQQSTAAFAETVGTQPFICEQGLAPKTIRTPEFSAVANYAYHLDAGKFVGLLQQHCVEKLGVHHIIDDIIEVEAAIDGDIAALILQAQGRFPGDLFIDCTGFSSLLLGQHYQIPWQDCRQQLFIDRALAVQVPYPDEHAPMACHTIATAKTAGWIWDIGLQQRRGVGYVYASDHLSEEQAIQELAQYVGESFSQLNVRKIPIRSGHRQQFWHRNCVAVGLSAGFLEPLEASALVLVELSAQMIAEQLPVNREAMTIIAKRFNETFHYRWQRIIDFLKLHYVLNQYQDLPFWVRHRDPSTVSDQLQELLTLWRYQPPHDHDFTSNNEVFPAASYQYVLYGMGFQSDKASLQRQFVQSQRAQQQFATVQAQQQQLMTSLPKHRDLINKIHQYGFQSI